MGREGERIQRGAFPPPPCLSLLSLALSHRYRECMNGRQEGHDALPRVSVGVGGHT